MSRKTFVRRVPIALACALAIAAGSCAGLGEQSGQEVFGQPPEQTGPYPAFAQAYRAGGPRERAKAVTGRPSLGDLVAALVEGVDDPAEKARIIHDWEAINISYDFEAFFSDRIPAQDAGSVLESRKAVCEGYSNLFRAMCSRAGVPCALIHGFGKGYGRGDPFSPMSLDRENHAWNAVMLKDSWLLVDVTWDSGYVSAGVTGFTRRFSTDYFLADPSVFIYDHLPSREGWQLLAEPLSPEQYIDLPFLEPGYFSLFAKPPSVPRAMEVAGTADIRFPAPRDKVSLLAVLYTYDSSRICTGAGNEVKDRAAVFMEGEEAVARFSFPKPGRYVALVFGAHEGSPAYDSVAAYGFEAKAGSASHFPQMSGTWKSAYRLLSPLSAPLVSGTAYHFRLLVPGETSLYVMTGENWSAWKELKPDANGMFDFSLTPPKTSKLQICTGSAAGSSHTFWTLLEYDVVAKR